MTEKTLKHELYKHGSYLLSLKESGSSFVNIDDEIKKNEELFQLASKKDLQPDLNIENNNNNITPWSQIMTDHQPAFAVGECYSDGELIYQIIKVEDTNKQFWVRSFNYNTLNFMDYLWHDYNMASDKPATAEQIATFKRAEHFASKGREWSEFRKGDIVQNTNTMQLGLVESVDEDGDAWVNYNIDKPLIYPSCCKCTGALFLNLIQTAEELQEVGE